MDDKFEIIFKKYYMDIYKFAYSYSYNREDSEDILQKVFYKLYVNKKIFSLEDNEIKKWLLRVCVNELRDLNRKIKKREICELNDNIICSDSNKNNSLLNYLINIPLIYRTSLYLYYYEGYGIKEISKMINKSESAVKMRLSRGKDLLRKEMEKEK